MPSIDRTTSELREEISHIPGTRILDDVNGLFANLVRAFPAALGGIDWSQCQLKGESVAARPVETDTESIERVKQTLHEFKTKCLVAEKSHCFVLSDDYLDFAIEIEFRHLAELLAMLIKLPHGIVVAISDFSACLEIRFCGNAYFGTP